MNFEVGKQVRLHNNNIPDCVRVSIPVEYDSRITFDCDKDGKFNNANHGNSFDIVGVLMNSINFLPMNVVLRNGMYATIESVDNDDNVYYGKLADGTSMDWDKDTLNRYDSGESLFDIVDVSNVAQKEKWNPVEGEPYYYIQFMDSDYSLKFRYYRNDDLNCQILKQTKNMFQTDSKAKAVHSMILDKFQCYEHQQLLADTLSDTLCYFNGVMAKVKLENGAIAKVIHIDNDSIIGVINNEKIVKWNSEGKTDDVSYNIVDVPECPIYASAVNYRGMHRGAKFYTFGVGLDIIGQTFCNTDFQRSHIASGLFAYDVEAASNMRQIIEKVLWENADV